MVLDDPEPSQSRILICQRNVRCFSTVPHYCGGPRPHFTLAEYVDLVRAMAEKDAGRSADRPDGLSRWLARTTVLRNRQRGFGDGPALRRWLADQTMQFRETPLRA